MSTYTCDDIYQFYVDPTNPDTGRYWNGRSVYSDAEMIFNSHGGCSMTNTVNTALAYNHYCGITNIDANFKVGCNEVLTNSAGSSIIFKRIVDNVWDDFNYTQIQNLSMWMTGNPKLTTNNYIPPLKKTYDGQITFAFDINNPTGFYLGLNGQTTLIFIEIPDTTSPIITATMSKLDGIIYFITEDLHTHFYNPLTQFWSRLSYNPATFSNGLPKLLFSPGMSNKILLAYTLDTAIMYYYRFNSSGWLTVSLPSQTKLIGGGSSISASLTGDLIIFGLYNDAKTQYRAYHMVNFGIPLIIPTIFTDQFVMCADTIYRDPSNNQYKLLCGFALVPSPDILHRVQFIRIWSVGPNDYLSAIAVPQPPHPYSFGNIGLGWGSINGPYALFNSMNSGTWISQRRPTAAQDWTRLYSFRDNEAIDTGTYAATFTIQIGAGIINWPQWQSDGIGTTLSQNWWGIKFASIPQFQSTSSANQYQDPNMFNDSLSFFINSMSSLPGASFILLDNGEIRCYSSLRNLTETTGPTAPILYWVSSTSDQSIQSATIISAGNYVEILFTNPLTVSSNGLYVLQYNQSTGRFLLMQNVINGTAISTWTTDGVLIPTYQDNYCNQLPINTITNKVPNTFPDSRCLCYNPRQLTASLFNVDLLAGNPAQLQLLDATSPCLFRECTQERGTGTITGIYMDEQVKCPSEIVICSTIVNVGQDGSISTGTGVNLDQNCGSTGSKLPCSSTCPVGMGCAKDGFCSLSCTDNSQCTGAGQTCNSGVCQLETLRQGSSFPTWAIILIVVVLIIIILGVALGLFYSRKVKQNGGQTNGQTNDNLKNIRTSQLY